MIAGIRLVCALILFVIVTPVMALLQFITMRTGVGNERTMPRLWHGFIIKLLGFRIHIHGQAAKKRPLLIVSNHISWTDIMVLGSILDVRFIAKTEVSKWPIFGALARLQRTIFVNRGQRRKSGEQAGEIAKELANGDPIVLFAEGSTGDGNGPLPFKSTLLAAAHYALQENGGDTSVLIQPVAIVYTRLHGMAMGRQHRPFVAWIGDQTLVPSLTSLLHEGCVDVEVHFGEPVEFGTGANRKKVSAEVENRVRTMMTTALRNPL